MSSGNGSGSGSGNGANRRRQIKGGGRAVMSRESQTAVIDLLMRMRNSSASEIEIETETETDFSDKPETLSLSLSLSAHERKRREAKFVKRLVREHEQKQWRTKLRSGGNSNINGNGNGNPNQATTAAAKPTENTTTTVTTTTTTAKKKTTTALPKTTTNANEKVRIELVEAIFKDGPSKKDSKKDNSKKKNSKSSVDNNGKKSSTTSSSSSSNSKSSNSNANKYKDGAKKVVVLPRSTTPAEILAKIAPAKLRLKTKPVRLFLKASSWSSSSSKTLLVELTDEADDLSGLDDGTTLYVTTTPAPGTTTTPAGGGDEATKKGGGADKSNNDNDNNNHNHNNNNNNHNDNQSADVESPIEAVADPLDSVKRAYHRQRDYRREMRKRERTQSGNNHISNKNNNNNKNNKNNNGNNNNNNNNKSRWCSAAAPNTNAGASRHAATRASLPAAAYREQILSAVENNRVVVLCGATGCGKSTQVPQFLIEGTGTPNDGSPQPTKTKTTTTTTTRRKYVVVTQPRRVAATSLANRVAEEQGSPPPGAPGSTVGYMVRLDRNIDETSCRIVYMTVGILLRMLVSESSVGAPASTSTSTGGDAKDSSSLSLSSSSSSDSSQPLPLTIENISHVVIDEVHERDANTDFVLTLLKGLLFSPSPSPLSHLKLILMSATASSDLFVRYFTPPRITVTANANANATATATATANPPVVLEIPGRTFPVDVRWLPECERFAGKRLMRSTSTSTTAPGRGEETETSSGGNANSSLPKLSPRATDAIDNDFIRALIVKIVQQQQSDGELDAKPDNSNSNSNSNDTTRAFRSTGAILVFLPGQGEIESLAARLTDRNNTNSTCIVANQDICTVLKLHSSVSRSEQDKVFRRARIGTVKIVLATNIAETSLTIPDVSHVIDACLVKESRYNAAKRTPELVTVWTSKASLKQRAGRAGRTSAGTCWRLCSETFCNEELLPQTAPEMLRIPLDELVLQIGLLYEQRRDDYHSRILHLLQTSSQKGGSACTITVTGAARRTAFPPGAQPIKFLSMTPAPPPRTSLVQACKHLLEVGALHVVDDGGSNSNSNSNSEEMDTWYYRLTPLGYHLSRLPMDARVGKVLIVGCILGCLDGALTIAAALSCTKSCFYPRPTKEHIHAREILVQNGFGGAGWPGGTAKGDLIAVVATYRAWTETKKESQKWKFCKHHALDYATLRDMDRLRNQFGGLLADAGFAARPQNNRDSNRNNNKSNDDGSDDWCHKASDDALLTSCCLVAGLYPNICSLIRPRKGGPRGGRLYTNDGDECIPQSNSFQCKRVREAAQTGKDAYAVYHAKHRTLGTTAAANHKKGASEIFLTEVNFVSRFALLLFGGDLEIVQNAIVVDGWLKFKVSSDNNSDGDKDNDTRTPKADTVNNAVLILALREQLDQMILERVVSESSAGRDPEGTRRTKERHESIIQVVRKLLSEEG